MGEKNSKLPLKRNEGGVERALKKVYPEQQNPTYAPVKSHTHIVSTIFDKIFQLSSNMCVKEVSFYHYNSVRISALLL